MLNGSASAGGASRVSSHQDSRQRDVENSVDRLIQQVSSKDNQRQTAPDLLAWNALRQLEAAAPCLTGEQKAHAESRLVQGLRRGQPNQLDARLLREAVHQALHPGAAGSLQQFLARKAFDGLMLPELKLREKGETEPGARTFNSILPPLAESTYDYGRLGRTLIWQGAAQLFEGPRREQRSDKLRKVVFAFPNPPAPGKPKLESPADFVGELDKLNVDEPVDVDSLRQRQNASRYARAASATY